jgi:autotransporter-associated beta strand protein
MIGVCARATSFVVAVRLAFAIVLVGFSAPSLATASTYTWAIDADGDWNNPANWLLLAGQAGAGYPNLPGDSAIFAERFTAPRTVTIPDGITITVGDLHIREGSSLLIAAAGAGRLALDPGGNSGGISTAYHHTAHVISAPVELHGDVTVELGGGTLTFTGGITESGGSRALTYRFAGILRFNSGASNAYTGTTTVQSGTLLLEHSNGTTAIPGPLVIGPGVGEVRLLGNNSIADFDVRVLEHALLNVNDATETIGNLTVEKGTVRLGTGATGRLTLEDLSMVTAHLTTGAAGSQFEVKGDITGDWGSVIDGGGSLRLTDTSHVVSVSSGPPSMAELRIDAQITGSPSASLVMEGPGLLRLTAKNTFAGDMRINNGMVLMNGEQPLGSIHVAGADAAFGGSGLSGPVSVARGTLAPGSATVSFDRGRLVFTSTPGLLRTSSLTMTPESRLGIQLNGASAGSGFDQVKVAGAVDLGNAILDVTLDFIPPPFWQVTLIDNDGSDAITSTFSGRPEGSLFYLDDTQFAITYAGGDGNDVVLRATAPTYLLAEGATGAFFDEDVLIANPSTTDAPVMLTFMKEDGSLVFAHRTVPAQSRLTVHVDAIPGLEATSASVEVKSDAGLPLVVERTMFWDASHYGGHTTNAVEQPRTNWWLAEGSQGFFDTYILIVNPNDAGVTVQATFARETGGPVFRTYSIGPRSRFTIYAGDDAALVNQSFGALISSTLPVVVERAMYFGSTGQRLWAGGHVNVGLPTPTPAPTWFHAEGATGSFFNTFILVSNLGPFAAQVTLDFLLETGDVITRSKTVPGSTRVTINPATEDPRLENAAFSTVVRSNRGIVSERSMYWPGEVTPFGEGHNSGGIPATRTTWGLAEGRVGGSHDFQTYILLANPESTAAEVTITYLREGSPPFAKTYTVPPRHRFNVDIARDVPELRNESFGARIEVTNGIPIAVERSMYWNANGVFWAGGTNALGTPIP